MAPQFIGLHCIFPKTNPVKKKKVQTVTIGVYNDQSKKKKEQSKQRKYNLQLFWPSNDPIQIVDLVGPIGKAEKN